MTLQQLNRWLKVRLVWLNRQPENRIITSLPRKYGLDIRFIDCRDSCCCHHHMKNVDGLPFYLMMWVDGKGTANSTRGRIEKGEWPGRVPYPPSKSWKQSHLFDDDLWVIWFSRAMDQRPVSYFPIVDFFCSVWFDLKWLKYALHSTGVVRQLITMMILSGHVLMWSTRNEFRCRQRILHHVRNSSWNRVDRLRARNSYVEPNRMQIIPLKQLLRL